MVKLPGAPVTTDLYEKLVARGLVRGGEAATILTPQQLQQRLDAVKARRATAIGIIATIVQSVGK